MPKQPKKYEDVYKVVLTATDRKIILHCMGMLVFGYTDKKIEERRIKLYEFLQELKPIPRLTK